MFEILVIIFIGIAIYRKVQSVRQENGSPFGSNSQPNVMADKPPVNNTRRPPVQSAAKSGSTQTVLNHNPAQQTMRHKSAQTTIQEARESGNSTTAYLMEKAEADAREHAKEKYEEQKRLYETRGGLAAAERYLDGDSIPQGKKCINCGYCGAENLVPMIPRTKYSCYFCREPL